MAKIVITNMKDVSVRVGDLYADVAPGKTVEKSASIGALLSMPALHRLIADGSVSLSLETNAGEDAILSLLAAHVAVKKD